MMSSKNWLKKIVIIIVGSVIAAYGITLALYAGFGGATLAVLWQGISETFHISIGMASFVVAVVMILFAAIYDRSQIQTNPHTHCTQTDTKMFLYESATSQNHRFRRCPATGHR